VVNTHPVEERIDTIDVWQLARRARWPILRVLARRFVEETELGGYVRELLATRRWSLVRVVPHVDERGAQSTHVFDVYGIRAT
jgi:hypothetical protein